MKKLEILAGSLITSSSAFILEIEGFVEEGLLEMTEWISFQSSLGLFFALNSSLIVHFFYKFLTREILLGCWHILYKRTFRKHFHLKSKIDKSFANIFNKYKKTLGKPRFLLDPLLFSRHCLEGGMLFNY